MLKNRVSLDLTQVGLGDSIEFETQSFKRCQNLFFMDRKTVNDLLKSIYAEKLIEGF